ncbi:hypothetical protein Pmani_030310 [Petrolisthes manimaculis]|uniref:Uncharacterized protein n=1 Tax=Petrolisthes manimaculis TaxID=1843537 RepID=A0AAE1NVU1_9EUCA|nr:hypothetical protein Pmani_030310 [Petrolisthes manimaculis]
MCFNDTNEQPVLRCQGVGGWEEVATIFTDYGLSHLASVDIINSPGLTDLPPLAFGQVGINAIRFYGTGLIYLESIVFSQETASQLQSLYIKHNSEFFSLENDVPGSLPNLQNLYCSYNNLGNLHGILQPTNVPYIDFGHDSIQTISSNYFYAASNLTQLLLPFNELKSTELAAGCFNFSGSGDDLYLDLGWNHLTQGINISAFGERMPKELVLSHNNITTLENAIFAPLLDQMLSAYGDSAYILLDHNELECACDMAWIVDHPGKDLFNLAECADGRLLSSLNMADFAHC